MIKHAANEMVMIAITFINVAAYIIVIGAAIYVGAVALHDDSFLIINYLRSHDCNKNGTARCHIQLSALAETT